LKNKEPYNSQLILESLRLRSEDQVKEGMMDRTCNTYGTEEKRIQSFGRKTWQKRIIYKY